MRIHVLLTRAVILGVTALFIGGCVPAPAHAAEESQQRFLFLQKYTRAADFNLERGAVIVWESNEVPGGTGPTGVLVEFKGVLDQESSDVLARLLQRRNVAYLSLSSPGGLVEPTLRLGQIVRDKSVATIVEGGDECYSACALLFLAGQARILGEYVPGKPTVERKQAIVGFHASYIRQTDGTKRYLQDIKTSRVCVYLKTVVPMSAAELCEYSLATKGMAHFSLALGRELGVFTAGEADVLGSMTSSAMASLKADDRRWVDCQRHIEKLLEGNPAFALMPEYREKGWPCSPMTTQFARGPTDPTQRVLLSRLAWVLGPADLPADVRTAALEEGAMKLEKMGTQPSDEHAIACQRARLFLNENYPLGSQDPRSPELQKTWGRNCFYRVYYTSTRVRVGVGALMAEQIPDVLDYVAKQRGPAWFPPDFVPMPPQFPPPKVPE
jgi:hypothetical protein